MRLTLHAENHWDSPWVFHALVALEEKKLAYDVQAEALPFSPERRVELAERAVLAKVPVLVHGDLWLTESLAITEYLEEAFPPPRHPALLPAGTVERARARQLMLWLRTDLMVLRAERPTTSIFLEPVTQPLSVKARAQADELLRVAERLLPAGSAALFGSFGMADADLALALQRLLSAGDPVPARLQEYALATWARPSVRAFLDRGERARRGSGR